MAAEYWLVSAPGDPTPEDTWRAVNERTGNLSANSKFHIPDLKVGGGRETPFSSRDGGDVSDKLCGCHRLYVMLSVVAQQTQCSQ